MPNTSSAADCTVFSNLLMPLGGGGKRVGVGEGSLEKACTKSFTDVVDGILTRGGWGWS